jgi:hypothetical protein
MRHPTLGSQQDARNPEDSVLVISQYDYRCGEASTRVRNKRLKECGRLGDLPRVVEHDYQAFGSSARDLPAEVNDIVAA